MVTLGPNRRAGSGVPPGVTWSRAVFVVVRGVALWAVLASSPPATRAQPAAPPEQPQETWVEEPREVPVAVDRAAAVGAAVAQGGPGLLGAWVLLGGPLQASWAPLTAGLGGVARQWVDARVAHAQPAAAEAPWVEVSSAGPAVAWMLLAPVLAVTAGALGAGVGGVVMLALWGRTSADPAAAAQGVAAAGAVAAATGLGTAVLTLATLAVARELGTRAVLSAAYPTFSADITALTRAEASAGKK